MLGGKKLVGKVQAVSLPLATVVVSLADKADVVHTVQVRLLSKHDPTTPPLPHELSIDDAIQPPAVNYKDLASPLMEQIAMQFLTNGYVLHQKAEGLVDVHALTCGEEGQLWQARAKDACDVNDIVLFPFGAMTQLDKNKAFKPIKGLHACLSQYVLGKCFTGAGNDAAEFIIKSPLPLTQKDFEKTLCARYWAVQELEEDSDSDIAIPSAVNMVRKEVKITMSAPAVEYSAMKFKKLKNPAGKKVTTFVFSTTVLTNKTELAKGDVLVVAKKSEKGEVAKKSEKGEAAAKQK